MNSPTIDPIEFGRVLGTLEAMERDMRDIRASVVDRFAHIEKRIDRVETRPAVASPTFKDHAIDKGLNTLLVALLAAIAKATGVL